MYGWWDQTSKHSISSLLTDLLLAGGLKGIQVSIMLRAVLVTHFFPFLPGIKYLRLSADDWWQSKQRNDECIMTNVTKSKNSRMLQDKQWYIDIKNK
jgi:hypothetical protein